MIKVIDEIAAAIVYLSIAVVAFAGIIILTAAFPLFLIFGALKNWRKGYNLMIALAMITVILWIIIGLRWLFTI